MHLRWRPGQGITDPGQCNHIPRIHARYHQHHRKISWRSFGRSSRYNERDDCKVERKRDVEISLSRPVRMPGVAEGRDDTKNIRWYGQQQGDDVAVAKGLNDGWEEVCNCAGGDEAEKEHHLISN